MMWEQIKGGVLNAAAQRLSLGTGQTPGGRSATLPGLGTEIDEFAVARYPGRPGPGLRRISIMRFLVI